jgi:hypothetical protein
VPLLVWRVGWLAIALWLVCLSPVRACGIDLKVFFPEHITVGMQAAYGGAILFPPDEACGPFDAGYRFVAGMQLDELLAGVDVLWLEIHAHTPPLHAQEINMWGEYLRRGGSLLVAASTRGKAEANRLLEILGARVRLGDDLSVVSARVPTPQWREDLVPIQLTEAVGLTGIDGSVTVLLEVAGHVGVGSLEAVGKGQLAVCAGTLDPLCHEDTEFDNGPFLQVLLGWLGTKAKAALLDERRLCVDQ